MRRTAGFVCFKSYSLGAIPENMELMQRATISLSAALLFLLSVAAVAAESDAGGEAKLKEHLINLERQSWEAWKNRDGKFFQDFLSDDHVEVGFGGVASKKEVVGFVGSPVCQVKSYELSDFELRMLDKDTALLTYREAQDTVCHKQVPSPCWVSSLYMKRGDRWLNVVYQQSQITN